MPKVEPMPLNVVVDGFNKGTVMFGVLTVQVGIVGITTTGLAQEILISHGPFAVFAVLPPNTPLILPLADISPVLTSCIVIP